MSSKAKTFQQAIDDLQGHLETKGADLREHFEPILNELKDRVSEEAQKTKDKVEEQVKENPLAAVGIVGLIFFILGFLFAYRTSRK
jgi:ElaB/YqjD/DUF883 family membrane-anchored ribosome-binding protein